MLSSPEYQANANNKKRQWGQDADEDERNASGDIYKKRMHMRADAV